MIPGWVAEAAEIFWERAGEAPPFPRDLSAVVALALPLHQHIMPRLRLATVDDWLRRNGSGHRLDLPDRRVRGCLLALRGIGVAFVDGADDPAERRFTLAHEVAHFLLDYQLPRERAVDLLGPSILPVLDGERIPSEPERIHAAVVGAPLGLHVHPLERRDAPLPIVRREEWADRLARELLAPDETLADRFDSTMPTESDLAAELVEAFGFPPPEAAAYAREWLAPRRAPSPLLRLRGAISQPDT